MKDFDLGGGHVVEKSTILCFTVVLASMAKYLAAE